MSPDNGFTGETIPQLEDCVRRVFQRASEKVTVSGGQEHYFPVATDDDSELLRALIGAYHAFRSYQYGNVSGDLAKLNADYIEELIKRVRGEK